MTWELMNWFMLHEGTTLLAYSQHMPHFSHSTPADVCPLQVYLQLDTEGRNQLARLQKDITSLRSLAADAHAIEGKGGEGSLLAGEGGLACSVGVASVYGVCHSKVCGAGWQLDRQHQSEAACVTLAQPPSPR
jgi:hypothetical protein